MVLVYNMNGVFLDGIHGTPYMAAPWILWVLYTLWLFNIAMENHHFK